MREQEHIWPFVSRPARYINHEVGAVHKDWGGVRTKVALIFPDTYELGMSHLGLRLLYQILNNREDILAERAYAPWMDMEAKLRRFGLPLTSLETERPLGEFDILGFTLPYELCYTNILNILDLSGIPLWAEERDERHPLIIGGGVGVANPEPVADFFDLFLLGDGEEAILEIVRVYQEWKAGGGDKQSLYQAMSLVGGVYIPSFFEPKYDTSGILREIVPSEGTEAKSEFTSIKRRVVPDLNSAPYAVSFPVPYLEITHDRIITEIARGCTRGCRFCQAGIFYRPVRERSPDYIDRIIKESLKHTGYQELSLASLSSGDYSCPDKLVEILKRYEAQRVAASLSSLRPGTLRGELIRQISRVRKTGFTIAPEAGTDRLRAVINKNLSHREILNTVAEVFGAGWNTLKLYFMVGLPTESAEDIEGLIDLVEEIRRTARGAGRRSHRFNLSISSFVPKAHTPFQWVPQDSLKILQEKHDYIMSRLKRREYVWRCQLPEISCMEGLLARGDRRLGPVLSRVWELGGKFEAWQEGFSYRRWQQAWADCGIDPELYTTRRRSLEEVLPWAHLNLVEVDFLKREYHKAMRGEHTPDCRYGCISCGACPRGVAPVLAAARMDNCAAKIGLDSATTAIEGRIIENSRDLVTAIPTSGGSSSSIPPRHRLRAKFRKLGRLRFLSHLELMRTFSRASRRAGFNLCYTQGFHPRPKLSFLQALPVGTESVSEYLELEVADEISAKELIYKLNRVLPEELHLLEARCVPLETPSLASYKSIFDYQVFMAHNNNMDTDLSLNHMTIAEHQSQIEKFLAQPDIIIRYKKHRTGKYKEKNIRPDILKFAVALQKNKAVNNGDQVLWEMTLSSPMKPTEVMRKLYLIPEEELPYIKVNRTGIWCNIEGKLYSPLEI